jgi:hypothetical protein
MVATTRTYAPKEVSVIVGGFNIKGKTSVSVEFREDRYTETTDIDGGITSTENAAWRLGDITLTMDQASTDNAILSGIHLTGAVVPVIVKDNSGNSIYTMAEGRIKKMPTAEFGAETAEREWIIAGNIDLALEGGNN